MSKRTGKHLRPPNGIVNTEMSVPATKNLNVAVHNLGDKIHVGRGDNVLVARTVVTHQSIGESDGS